MPIVQLQSEFSGFISPTEYTWASKPPAAGNAGKEIILTDMGRSRWASNGAYWYPVGGYAVLKRNNLQSITGTYPALAEVPNAFNGFVIPNDLAQSPGRPTFEVRANAQRTGTLGAAQAYQLSVGFGASKLSLGVVIGTSAAPSTAGLRTFALLNSTDTEGNYINQNYTAADAESAPVSTINLSGIAPALFAQNGANDGSESFLFGTVSIAIYLTG